MIKGTGLKIEAYKFTDHSHERIFGTASLPIAIEPIGRDVSGVPIVFQGSLNVCVACSVTWYEQWVTKTSPEGAQRLSWPFLAAIAGIGQDGAAPSQVFEPARKDGIVKWDTFEKKEEDKYYLEAANYRVYSYSVLTDYSKKGIYAALKRSPLAIGVLNWKGVGDHMMIAYDVTPDGSALKALSWWNEDHQTEEIVQFEQVEVAYSFAEHSEVKNHPFLESPY